MINSLLNSSSGGGDYPAGYFPQKERIRTLARMTNDLPQTIKTKVIS